MSLNVLILCFILICPAFSFRNVTLSQHKSLVLGWRLHVKRLDKPNWGPIKEEIATEEEGKEFFDYIFSQPVYEARDPEELPTEPPEEPPKKIVNRNVLKNLGKYAFDKMLKYIRNVVNQRVKEENRILSDGQTSTSSNGADLSYRTPADSAAQGPVMVDATSSCELGGGTDVTQNMGNSQIVNTDGMFGTGRPVLESQGNEDEIMMAKMKRDVLKYRLNLRSLRNNFKTVRLYKSNDYLEGLNFRRLGESDLVVSELGVGTSMFDNPELVDRTHAVEIMETALKRYAINFFDTCEYDPYPYDPRSYLSGNHASLREFLSLVDRHDVVIFARISSNNFGNIRSQGRFLSWVRDDINSPPNVSYKLIREVIEGAVDGLLSRLGTDYLDILSFVYPYRYLPLSHLGEDTYCWSREREEFLDIQCEAFNKLVQKGKIKYVGLSNETIWGLYRILNHPDRKFKVACTQQLYNLLHRNELESSGLVEGSLYGNFNCPIVSYGVLAGGILTGKYLDPERINPAGADKVTEYACFSDIIQRGEEVPEDYGHLSYGPSNARCNIFPETYHTHRSVWCQHATAEYLKIARTHGLTLSQLSIAWTLSRPFVRYVMKLMSSSIIGMRTIGQLHETVGALNYPVTKDLEEDIHEVYLRYRAPTMGGPQLLTGLHEDYNDVPMSQNERLKSAGIPIWSGGSHWNMDNIPPLIKLQALKAHREGYNDVKRIFGLLDKPNDSRWSNYRCWVERIHEGLPGEYFAVKESALFSWDKMKLVEYTVLNKTPEEIKEDDTSNFHFYWKNGKVYVGETTEAIRNFYEDPDAVCNVIKGRERSFLIASGYNRIPKDWIIWSQVDADLVYKRLMDKYGIDVLNSEELEKLLYKADLDEVKLNDLEEKCKKFAYFKGHIKEETP